MMSDECLEQHVARVREFASAINASLFVQAGLKHRSWRKEILWSLRIFLKADGLFHHGWINRCDGIATFRMTLRANLTPFRSNSLCELNLISLG